MYIGQWYLSPLQSRHLGTSHSCPNHHHLPHHIFLNLFNGLNSPPFQRWFQFGEKPEVTGHQIWVVAGMSHLGNLMFHQKLFTRHGAWAGTLWWWSCQSPVAHTCGLLNHPKSFHRGMPELNARFDADFIALLIQSFWMYWPHSTHAHSKVSTTPTD